MSRPAKPLTRETIAALFSQALVGYDRQAQGGWLDVLERMTRLIEAEIQVEAALAGSHDKPRDRARLERGRKREHSASSGGSATCHSEALP